MSTEPPASAVGLAVTKLITPVVAFLPFKVPWGPLSTSIRSKSNIPMSLNTLSFVLWPLDAVTTEDVLAAPTPKEPIPLIVYADPDPTDLPTPSPGTCSAISSMS